MAVATMEATRVTSIARCLSAVGKLLIVIATKDASLLSNISLQCFRGSIRPHLDGAQRCRCVRPPVPSRPPCNFKPLHLSIPRSHHPSNEGVKLLPIFE